MKSYISPFNKCRIILVLIGFLGFTATLKAQQFQRNTEIGLLMGTSYYLGDLNKTHFNNPSLGGGIVVRENIDRRFTYKAELLFLNIRADDKNNSKDTIAQSRELSFQSAVYELSGQIEFNFLPYDPGNPLYIWTPFVYTGISLFNFNPKARDKENQLVALQSLGTEGQGTEAFLDREKYSLTQVSIPLGGGIKIAMNPSFNIILEYGIRKTFTDYLDDVSQTYPMDPNNPVIGMSPKAIEMSDPTGEKIQGDQRGDLGEKNDWYSYTGITLSWKLNNKTKGCDY